MAKNTQRQFRLEMETLEDRLVPAFSGVQLVGSTLIVQGASTPDRVQVLERGDKILVQVTDLSSGATVKESFKKDKVHSVQLRQGSTGQDLFDNELRDRRIATQTFSKEGLEIGDDNGGGAARGADDGAGHTSGHR
jgi:hypothetical protein